MHLAALGGGLVAAHGRAVPHGGGGGSDQPELEDKVFIDCLLNGSSL